MHTAQSLHELAQPFVERFGFLAEFFFNFLADLMDIALSVNALPDIRAEFIQSDMARLRCLKEFLCYFCIK